MLEGASLRKSDVAQSFGAAASTYDAAADVQQQVGRQLLQLLPRMDCSDLMDLGCGTGYFLEHMARHYPRSRLHALDLSEGMLRYARSRNPQSTAAYYCGDAEHLPLVDASMDIIFSSLTLQWCPDFRQALAEASRVLRRDGRLLVSILGPDTLQELRAVWSKVDRYVHVNQFNPLQSILGQAIDAGFQCHAEEQVLTMRYRDFRELAHSLKAIGAHNINQGRARGLTGKQRLRRLLAEYDCLRDDAGLLPATYQVYYLCLRKA